MFAVLLNISKPVLDRISRNFIENENPDYSLSEVVEAWLEEINASDHESSTETRKSSESEPSRYWLQVYHVVKSMGHEKFARDLDAKHSKPFKYRICSIRHCSRLVTVLELLPHLRTC